jgi:hypothetical protein
MATSDNLKPLRQGIVERLTGPDPYAVLRHAQEMCEASVRHAEDQDQHDVLRPFRNALLGEIRRDGAPTAHVRHRLYGISNSVNDALQRVCENAPGIIQNITASTSFTFPKTAITPLPENLPQVGGEIPRLTPVAVDVEHFVIRLTADGRAYDAACAMTDDGSLEIRIYDEDPVARAIERWLPDEPQFQKSLENFAIMRQADYASRANLGTGRPSGVHLILKALQQCHEQINLAEAVEQRLKYRLKKSGR